MKSKKFRILSMILAVTMLAGLLAGCGGGDKKPSGDGGDDKPSDSGKPADPGKVYELSFTIHDPATSSKVKRYEELAAATKEATNGGLNITVYPGGTLVASTDVAEGVLTGSADMGWLFTTFFPGQFPLAEVVTLPMQFEDSTTATKVLLEMYKQSPELQKELEDYKILNLYCNPINYVFSNKPVRSMADMKGQTLRAPAGVPTDMITAWGGTPILMGPGDVYQSVEKGVIDGCTFEWSGFNAFKLAEVIKYCSEIPVYCGVFMTAMNQDSYDNLPADYQKALDEIWGADETSVSFAQVFMDDVSVGMENGAKEGMEIITFDDTALAEFQASADEYVANWIKTSTTADFDAQAYYDLMLNLRDEVK